MYKNKVLISLKTCKWLKTIMEGIKIFLQYFEVHTVIAVMIIFNLKGTVL